jgi:hypothetical protein
MISRTPIGTLTKVMIAVADGVKPALPAAWMALSTISR